MKTILYLNAMGEISGAERSLLAMLDALDRTRWQPLVAAPDGPLLEEAAAREVPVFPLPLAPLRRPHGPGMTLAVWRAFHAGSQAVNRLAREVMPTLIHANSTAAMLYALRVRRIPTVWQVRDLTPLGGWGGQLYERAARVVTISATVRDALLPYAHDGGARLRVIHPAVDTQRFRPVAYRGAPRRLLGLPPNGPLIGLVAQFVPWKRHGLFLDALERLLDRPWHAVLAGADFGRDDDYVAALRARLEEPPLAGRVSWLPWQSAPETLFAALDLCALTSQCEPFGRAVMEAMACGVPVVAVAEGGPCELVFPQQSGLLVPPDPGELAAALSTLLDDHQLREQYGCAARERAEEAFSLAAQTEALTNLYDEMGR